MLYKKYKNVTTGNYFHNFEKILDKIFLNMKFKIWNFENIQTSENLGFI